MDECNISNDDHVIIYGRESVLFTPRIWFTFKSFGHPHSKLHIMQGSLEDWMEKGGAIESEKVYVPKAKDIIEKYKNAEYTYDARATAKFVYSMEDLLEETESDRSSIIIDSRGSSYVKGNIPGSYHIPYSTFQTEKSTVIKSPTELRKEFENVGVDPKTEKPIICSCGTGVSACTTFLALELCGRNVDVQPTYMYDGSWYEWSRDPRTPKET